MRPPPPTRRIVPLLAAVAGVVFAHALDYLVLFPDAGRRDGHLLATGHAYWPVAVGAAAGGGAMALLIIAARGGLRTAEGRAAAYRLNLGWLVACQVGAFVVVEAGERAVVGLPPSVLIHSPELWLGLALQLPVAWLARGLLGAAEGVAHRLAVSHAPPPARPRPDVRWRPTPHGRPSRIVIGAEGRPRAPPALVCS